MLGKIVRRKNFHIVAEAVNGMDIDCELHIIGTQPDSTYVQELTKINPNIVFHQNITDQALAYLLTYMDIFVHPSGSEAMSMAVLEAMASGLPIICSPVCEEQVGGAGFIVNSKRPKQWRLAVEAILQNPQAYHSLSAESRRLAETKYSWDVVAQQVEQVYKWAVQV
jgi:glycosyltransferase involved in cell wall biosynthesis